MQNMADTIHVVVVLILFLVLVLVVAAAGCWLLLVVAVVDVVVVLVVVFVVGGGGEFVFWPVPIAVFILGQHGRLTALSLSPSQLQSRTVVKCCQD